MQQGQNFQIADIIGLFAQSFIAKHKPNSWQLRTLDALIKCRTAAMGGHKYQCDHCRKIHISYNSCRNRHCPKCQVADNSLWIENRMRSILPVKHYHFVFTVPEILNGICILNSRWFYNQLFACAWDSLRQFGYTHFGAESGAICILHTWGQNLSLHPHIHCIVPAAGLNLNGRWKYLGKSNRYLYPVRNISHVFRAKFMMALQKHPKIIGIKHEHKDLVKLAWKKPWVVYCQQSLAKPEHIIKYLGQYIHRIAITNNRLVNVNKAGVSFKIKDYRNAAKIKNISLSGEEFLRRFCLHILPKRFVRIRYYGIYNKRFANGALNLDHKMVISIPETKHERIKRITGIDLLLCPACKKGKLLVIEVIPKARLPSRIYKSKLINHETS